MKMTFSKAVSTVEHTPFATFTNKAISRDSFHNWLSGGDCRLDVLHIWLLTFGTFSLDLVGEATGFTGFKGHHKFDHLAALPQKKPGLVFIFPKIDKTLIYIYIQWIYKDVASLFFLLPG